MEPFIGEIRMFGGNFAPQGWSFCDGSIMPISQNDVLFQLIGTTYGGDGQQTFALPDLRGRLPIHQGNGFAIGQSSGAEVVTLTANQLPLHTHGAVASGSGDQVSPKDGFWSSDPGGNTAAYIAANTDTMATNAIGSTDPSAQPHDNMQPFLAVSYIISLFGIFPSQN